MSCVWVTTAASLPSLRVTPSLQNKGRAAAMERDADRMRRVTARQGGKEIGLALDGCGAAAFGEAAPGRHPAKGIAQRHDRAAMEHAAPIAELFPHDQPCLASCGRAKDNRYAQEPAERGNVGSYHCLFLLPFSGHSIDRFSDSPRPRTDAKP
jgi:hypothetical protein